MAEQREEEGEEEEHSQFQSVMRFTATQECSTKKQQLAFSDN